MSESKKQMLERLKPEFFDMCGNCSSPNLEQRILWNGGTQRYEYGGSLCKDCGFRDTTNK